MVEKNKKEIMSNVAIYNWNSVLDDVIKQIKKKHTLLSDYEGADVTVLWCESDMKGWKEGIDYTHKRGNKVIVYQQGIWGMDWIRPPFNEPIISDIVCVWGEGDKKRLISYGVPEEKIRVTGCQIIQRLTPRVKHEGKNVVFALEHWDWGDVVENNIVASELRKLEGVKVITKGLHKENDTEIFENPIISDRFSSNHLETVAEVLSTADLVIGISESTFHFLAEYLDIPVIIPDIWTPKSRGGDDRYLKFEKNYSNAITKVKLEDLNDEIYKQLEHPEILRAERKQAVIDNGGVDIKDPVGEFIKVIEENL